MSRPTAKAPVPAQPSLPWRWVFLCSEAALVGLMLASMYGWSNAIKTRTVDDIYHPVRGGIVRLVLGLTTPFQAFASPFFFRRLGSLALVAWFSALAAFI